MELTHKGYECEVVFDLYADNKNVAIILLDKGDDEIVSVASVNVDHKPADNVVGIKTWSENEGIVDSLVKGNVIKDDLLYMEPTGFVAVEYYQLTDEALTEVDKIRKEIEKDS